MPQPSREKVKLEHYPTSWHLLNFIGHLITDQFAYVYPHLLVRLQLLFQLVATLSTVVVNREQRLCCSATPGKERDNESGLDVFGARYYGSSLGRFMTPDWAAKPTAVPYVMFGNPQSLNLYSYVGNNPLMHADPDGHCWPAQSCYQAIANFVNNFSNKVFNNSANSSPAVAALKTFGAGVLASTVKMAASPLTMGTATGTCTGGSGCSADGTALAVGGDVLKGAAIAGGLSAAAGSLTGAAATSASPSLVGFSDSDTTMIGQSMKNLSGAGYDLSPMQQLVKADLPPGCCGMSLSTAPTGAALGDGAFSSQQMLDHTMEEELLHLNQDLPSQTFGPGTAAEMEAGVDAARKIPQPNQ
jgi:RHS repeat-associated protein